MVFDAGVVLARRESEPSGQALQTAAVNWGVGGGQWAVGSLDLFTIHHPLPTIHYPLPTARRAP
jgi:hypothetical protein